MMWNLALSLLLAACAALFGVLMLRLQRRVHALEKAANRESERVQAVLQMMDGAIDCLSEQARDACERAGVLVAPAPPRSGLNLGKRSQALRLYRHGETADKIAMNLDLPRADVKLLLKVHQSVLKLSGAV
ncbi:MAG: hypothetical protein M3Z36_07765 [Acidobacteriota bacterium]|nr:hypothetical protein [Acidobacteriota bacterium]